METQLDEIELAGIGHGSTSGEISVDEGRFEGLHDTNAQNSGQSTAKESDGVLFAQVPASNGEQLDDSTAGKGGGSTMFGASSNFINSIIGAGIIGLPFAMKEAGTVLGSILLLGIALATYFGVTLIIKLGVLLNEKDYESLAGRVFGNAGWVIINVANAMFGYGACCAYLIIMTDTVTTVIAHWALGGGEQPAWMRHIVLGATASVLVLPLSLVGNMATLAWSSGLSLIAVAWILAFTIARLATGPGNSVHVSSSNIVYVGSEVLPSIGVFAFAYVCHHNSFLVFHSLDVPSLGVWRSTARMSLVVAFFASLCLGLVGYFTFRGDTYANILNNYASIDEWANVTRVGYALTMILTYPMEVFVVRHCVGSLLGLYIDTESPEQKPSLSSYSHVIITGLIFASSVGIAVLVTDLGIVLELTGGISATIIGFIMPGLLRITIWLGEDRNVGTSFVGEIVPSFLLAAFGIFALFATTIASVAKML